MVKTWFISDTHFGHVNAALKFTKETGEPLRLNTKTGERFSSVDEMDQFMVDSWNSVVKSEDRVYHLGDVAIPKRGLQNLKKLNGRIRLVAGNHDPGRLDIWNEFPNITDICGAFELRKINWILTHIPVRESQLERFSRNIHGHLHAYVVRDSLGNPDIRYFNVSVERLDFTPINIDELKERIYP
jgi:calcineurin-like phosphoesterase family protein